MNHVTNITMYESSDLQSSIRVDKRHPEVNGSRNLKKRRVKDEWWKVRSTVTKKQNSSTGKDGDSAKEERVELVQQV